MAFQQGDLNATLTLQDFMSRELKKSENSVKQFATRSRASLNKLGKAFLTLGGAVSAFGAARFLGSSIKAFTRQEKAIAGMEQVMKSMGRFTPELSAKMQELASSIQEVGISGDEAIIEGQKFLITYGKITDELLPDATRTMADLAALTGKDMVSAANLLGKASEGMTGELKRYGISLSEASIESKDFELILKDIQKQVEGQQRALRQTGFGGIEAFKNAWGDLKEEVGEVLTKALIPFVKEATKEIEKMDIATTDMVDGAKKTFGDLALLMALVADGITVARMGMKAFEFAAVTAGLVVRQKFAEVAKGLEIFALAGGPLSPLNNLIGAFRKLREGSERDVLITKGALSELTEEMVKLWEKGSRVEDLTAMLERFGEAAEKAAAKPPPSVEESVQQKEALKARRQMNEELLRQTEIQTLLNFQLATQGKTIGVMPTEIKAVTKATNDYTGSMEDLQKFWGQVFETIEDSKKATIDMSDRVRTFQSEWDLWYGKNTEKTAEILELNEALRSSFQGAAQIIESTFIRALDESLEKGVQWRKLAQDILGDFSKMAISMAFKFGVSAASSAIFGAEKGGVFDGLGDRVPVRTYARGGVMGGQTEMAIMNEGRRREAVVPLPDNRSIPVKLLDGGGRGDLHIHLDGVLDGQSAVGVLERHADNIMAIVNRKQRENPQQF